MKSNLYYYITILLLFSCTSGSDSSKLNGALESLQLSAQQKLYPDFDRTTLPYFEEIANYENRNQVSNREDLPEPWEAIGPHNIAGRALALAINPLNNKTIYVGSASGGLWRSYNKGKGITWEQIPLGYPVLGVSSIAFAAQDSMTIYIGTGEVYNKDLSGHGAAYRSTRGTYGMGILKSSDGGTTWVKSLDWSYESLRGIHVVKVAPSNPNTVYAGTTHGTYKSTDAGITWNQINQTQLCTDLLIHPDDEDDVIIACGNFGSPGKGIYSTKDGGTSWDYFEPNNFQGKIQLAQFDNNPNVVYASIGNGFGFNDGATWVFRTTNRATSWSLQGTTDYSKWQGWFAHDIAVNPFDEKELTLIGIEIYQSDDSGKTANLITIGGVAFGTPPIGEPDGPANFTHSDHHDVIYDPSDGKTIYVANDGGVYGSFDGGTTWQSLNGGLQTAQFYNGFSVFPSDSEVLAMGGLQDNSTIIYTNSKAWNRVIGGDGSWSALHPSNSDIRYGSLQNLNVFKVTNGSNQYNQLPIPGVGTPTSFIAPYVLAPSNPNTIYAGRSNIYKSNDGGNNWSVFGGLNGDFAFAMEVSPSNSDFLYVATAPNNDRPRIYVSKNGGESFSDITGNLPNLYINDIHVNSNDFNKVYITCGGFGDAQVFKSHNAGQDWTDITKDLPKIPTSAIIADPADDSLLYVGNDYGVFYSEDDGETWFDFNQGITDAILVMDLKVNPKTRKIYVATHGSGALVRDMISRDLPSKTSDINSKNIHLLENPIRGNHLVILGLDQFSEPLRISIFDNTGRLIEKTSWHKNQYPDEFRISIQENMPPGTYFVKISSETWKESLPFVKL